ncbi:MAG: RNA methyltransferase, partial [Chloroflexales bacterium]|nr:RNA methyltransferase [Chloroflexales bacterium]
VLRAQRAGPAAGAPLPAVSGHATSAQHPSSLALLSGPEGGITPDELTAARAHGMMPVSLGPRILRAETAPVAAAAMLMYELEV